MKKFVAILLAALLLLGCLGTAVFAADAECSYTVDGVTKEGTLLEAAAAVSPKGGSVKLLKDVAFSTEKIPGVHFTSDSSFSMDLNGHTISGYRLLAVTGKGVPGVTHIYDSVGGGALVSVAIPINVHVGAIRLENITSWCDTQQNVAYYDTTGDYNEQNLIVGCTLANNAWGAVAFNNTKEPQSKVCITVEDSILAATKASGSQTVVRQSAAVSANIEFGKNVQLLTYHKSSVVGGGVLIKGQRPAKQDETVDFKILDKTFEGMSLWATSADGESAATAVPENPLDRVQGYKPEVSADADTVVKEPETPPVAETPAEQPVKDIVTLPAGPSAWEIASAVLAALAVVLDVVILVALKKKK